MAVMKRIFEENYDYSLNIENEIIQLDDINKPLTLLRYAKKNGLFLLADFRKIEKEHDLKLGDVLQDALTLSFNKQLKKPRVKVENNKLILFSEKYNYNLYHKTYYLNLKF